MKAIEISGDQEFEALTRALAGNGAAAQRSQNITLVALRRRVNRVAADVGVIKAELRSIRLNRCAADIGVIKAELGRLTSQVDRVADDVGVIKAALIKSSKAPQIRAAKIENIQRLTARHYNASQIENIQRVVARHYNVHVHDLISARRDQRVVWPRHIAMYLARTDSALTLPQIAREFCRGDHTTVIHAVRKIEALIETAPMLAVAIEAIRKELAEGA